MNLKFVELNINKSLKISVNSVVCFKFIQFVIGYDKTTNWHTNCFCTRNNPLLNNKYVKLITFKRLLKPTNVKVEDVKNYKATVTQIKLTVENIYIHYLFVKIVKDS